MEHELGAWKLRSYKLGHVLGLPFPLSELWVPSSQQMPLVWAWAQKWGWLECCRVVRRRLGGGFGGTDSHWAVQMHAMRDRPQGS